MSTEKSGEFWGQGSGSNPQPGADAGFWQKVEHQKLDERDQSTRGKPTRPRRRWLRVFAVLLVLLIVAVVGLAIAAPTIAGSLAPGLIAGKSADFMNGRATIESASFGWSGPQSITGLKIVDKNNATVLSVKSIEVSAGLWGLATGNLNIGTVAVSGVRAEVVRDKDGQTNLQQLAKSAPSSAGSAASSSSSGGGGGQLPSNLHVKLVLKGLDAAYTDHSAPGPDGKPLAVVLNNLDASAGLGAGEPLKVNASGQAGALTANAPAGKTGSIAIDATVDHWCDSSGKITTDRAAVNAKVDVKSFPLALVDAFAGGKLQGGSLRQGLGETADLAINASGDMDKGGAEIQFTTANATAQGKLKFAANTITTETPFAISVKGAAVPGLSPKVRQALESQQAAKIDAIPDARVTIDKLKLALPRGGAPMNLNGSGALVTLNLTETKGSAKLAENDVRPFRIAPLTATVDAQDLAQPVHVTAASTADISGQPAGSFNVDITAAGILNASGAPAGGMPSSVNGGVSIKGFATAIAQSFVAAYKLDLPTDVGPTLDADLKIATDPKAPAGQVAGDADFAIKAQFLSAGGALRYDNKTLTTKGDGLRFEAAHAASIAGRFVSADTGYLIAPAPNTAALVITVRNLSAPLNASNQPDMKALAVELDSALGGVNIQPAAGGAPLELQTFAMHASVLKGGALKATVDSKLAHENAPFTLSANADIQDLLTNDANGAATVAMGTMKPKGTIELKNVPAAIAHLAPQKAPAPAEPGAAPAKPLDLAALLRGVAGPQLNVTVTAAGVSGTSGAYDTTLALNSQRLTADVALRAAQDKIELRTLGANANIEPDTVNGLLQTFAPTVQGSTRLAAPSRLTLTVDPVTIPRTPKGELDLAHAGRAALKVTLPGRTVVEGLRANNPDGTQRDLGKVGVQDFELTASAPLAAAAGPVESGQRALSAKIKGSVLGNAGEPIGVLDADLAAEVSDKQLAGALTAKLDVSQVNVAALEQIGGQNGKISGAIGNTAHLRVEANSQPPAGSAAPFDASQATIAVQASLEAPKLRTDGPIAAAITPDAIRLTRASKLTLDVDPAWAQQYLQPANPAPAPAPAPRHDGVLDKLLDKPAAQPAPTSRPVTIQEIAPIAISLDRLALPRAQPGKKSSVALDAGIVITLPKLAMTASDGSNMRLTRAVVDISSGTAGPAGVPVNFRVGADEVAIADKPPVKGLGVTGVLQGLVSPEGGIDAKNAVVSAQGDMPQIPTVLLDALTKKDGTLVDALGSVTAVKFNIERYPLSGVPAQGSTPPVIDLAAKSDRTTASLRGTVRDKMYVSERPLQATVTEVTKELSSRYITALPLLGTFEKTPKDAPASLEVKNITASLENDLSKLNADVVFDPGEARFGTSGVFNELLKTISIKDSGQVGRRLEPLIMQVRSGIATYQRWKVPLGEFTVQTEGTVDLVNKQLDVVTYIPFGALSDKAVGKLNLGAGSALTKILPGAIEALTLIPFRTKGPMSSPSTNVDPEMLAKNLGKTLDPGRLIKDNLGDLFKKPTTPPK